MAKITLKAARVNAGLSQKAVAKILHDVLEIKKETSKRVDKEIYQLFY